MPELLAVDTDGGARIDRFVTAHCPELSRSRMQELLDVGLILVNGKPSRIRRNDHRDFPASKLGNSPD
jgi:hypothetical protein